MAKHVSSDERRSEPQGVEAGPQSGQGGAGGEPKGATLDPSRERAAAADAGQRPEHASDTSQPGYRTRPAGQSGVGEQDDRTSTIREPRGDGNYVATDRGDQPLRNG